MGQTFIFAMKTQVLVHVSHKFVILLSHAPHVFEVVCDISETWKNMYIPS